MKYKFFSDSHIHSDNSSNALDPIVKICETAVDRGFYSITVVDNCECDTFEKREYEKSLKQLYFEAKKTQISFANDLQVFSGMELSQMHRNIKCAKKFLNAANFDFVLAAVHNIKGLSDFYDIDYSEGDIYNILNDYLDEVLEVVNIGLFDSLAHFNYPIKYITKYFGIAVDSEKVEGKVRYVLSELAREGKALEINTSSAAFGDVSIFSNQNLLYEFKKAGGKYVTVGSGAHKSENIGRGIEQSYDMLLKAGFDNFTVFKNRAPMQVPIKEKITQ